VPFSPLGIQKPQEEPLIRSFVRIYGDHRVSVTALLVTLAFSINACTIRHAPIPSGTIPEVDALTAEEEEFGQYFLEELCEDYELDPTHQCQDQLIAVLDHLTQVADVAHNPWHIHLFRDPEIANVRAVHGNYVFVWSGLVDIVESEDEIAGVLAHEIAHVLSHHTDPVQFTIWSEIFFEVASLATSIAVLTVSHGVVAIGGSGWMKWVYTQAADLNPLDREYSDAEEREATEIALLIMARSKYSPEAILEFWRRVQGDETLQDKVRPLSRNLSPEERVALLEELLQELPAWTEPVAEQKQKGNSRTSAVLTESGLVQYPDPIQLTTE
jgi:predicted Zn-dependent protease